MLECWPFDFCNFDSVIKLLIYRYSNEDAKPLMVLAMVYLCGHQSTYPFIHHGGNYTYYLVSRSFGTILNQ